MRWTRQRFARDGIAGLVERLVSDQQHADERRLLRTAKSCGPDAPTLASSSRSCVGPTGFRQNLALRMTVAKEPGHRGEHDISRKTIACGNAGRFRCPRCYSCAFYHYQVHTRPRVQRASGVPHALFGRKIYQRLGRMAQRGRERASGIKTTSLRAKRGSNPESVIPGWSAGPDPESRDSGFDASHRPGMTMEASLTRLGILDVEFAHRAGDDKIIVVEHQRARDAVLVQFERHRINRRLFAVLG